MIAGQKIVLDGTGRATPDANTTVVRSLRQEVDGPWRRLRGAAEIDTLDAQILADEIDYNAETEYAEARGNVRYTNRVTNERMKCDRLEYHRDTGMGKFYNVSGTSPAKIDARPGLLMTANPFYFEGDWAEKIRENIKGQIRERYVLHDGFVTDCKLPRPTWILSGPKFDIVAGERAIGYRSVYRLRGIPLFYAPVLYKSLRRLPRRSGILLPNLTHSSRRGWIYSGGYYWAINRSYDLTYRPQYFSKRGLASTVDFRGRPSERSDFNVYFYGVKDRGAKFDDGTVEKQGGYYAQFNGRTELWKGFSAQAHINYLSNFRFRQNFTESFAEAISAETHSTALLTKHWSSYGFNLVYQRDENFQSAAPGDKILIRRLPMVNFLSRERQVNRRVLPVWVSFDSTFGLLHRDQPEFQTRQYVDRGDVAPRIMTNVQWKGFSLTPSFSARGTHYGSSFVDGRVRGDGVWRFTKEFLAELNAPSLSRVMKAPRLLGDKMKHVIQTRATFRHVDGVEDFARLVRFDATELVSNTTELEVSLANRVYVKKKDGSVSEVLSWEVWQRRYFDPEFGGALVAGRRNVILSSADLSSFAFFDQSRRYSPIVSSFRFAPGAVGVEWRADYDPLRGHVVNSSIAASGRWSQYSFVAGHNHVRSSPVLSPNSNQFQGAFTIGNDTRRGWNARTQMFYNYRAQTLTYMTGQVTYNWDCCGFSVQYRRFDVGNRQENQFRMAFAIANIGSFGTLRRQELLF